MGSSYAKKPDTDLTFVFPHIHYENKWDIANSSSLWSYFINNNLAEPLIRLDSKTNYKPAIASSWFLSKDKKEITFTLNDSYKFHDKNLITLKDIYNSILRVLRLKVTAHSDLQQAICDSEDCSKNITLNSNKLKIKLNKPQNGILFNFASPEYGIVPSEYIKKDSVDKEDLFNLSGPYKLNKFEKKNIYMSAFKDHPFYSQRAPQNVRITEIIDINESIEYYKKNKNIVLVGSEYSSSYRLNKLKGNKFSSSFSLTEFIVPNRRSNVFQKTISLNKLKQIINHAKNKLELDESLTELTNEIFTRDNLARINIKKETKSFSKLDKRVDLKMIVFDWMKDSPIPYQLKNILLTLNINLSIEIKSISDYQDVISKREYDLLYIYSGVSALDPIVELTYLSKHPLLDFQYKNQAFLSKLENCKTLTIREKYIQQIREMHELILKQNIIIPLFHTRMLYITNSNFKIEDMNHFDGGLDLWQWKH